MPAYNFKAQFAQDVEFGRKRQTIRPRRKRPTVPGDTLYLNTGMRTKACRRLRTETCKIVTPIEIRAQSILFIDRSIPYWSVEAYEFAQRDGFRNAPEFFAFFEKQYGLPTSDKDLELITW